MRVSTCDQRSLDFCQPARLNIESQDLRLFWALVLVGVMLPCINQYRLFLCQRSELPPYAKGAVRTTDFNEKVTMMVGMTNQGGAHVEQCDPTESTLKDFDGA
jgi:hypothetical protein